MRFLSLVSAGPFPFVTTAWAVASLVASADPAFADLPPISLIPPVGGVAHFHLTRTTQGTGGPQAVAGDVTLRRKSQSALTIEGTLGAGPLPLTVLNVSSDGSLAIPKNDKSANEDAPLVDAVAGLNRMTEVVSGEYAGPHDGWTANLALPDVRGATGPVVVPVTVANSAGADFDFRGEGQLAIQPPNGGDSERSGGRRGGFHGGFPGGGPPGGGGQPGGPPGGDRPPGGDGGGPPRQSLNVAVSVDGHVRHGSVNRISIQETRSIAIASEPYVNVSGWTLETR